VQPSGAEKSSSRVIFFFCITLNLGTEGDRSNVDILCYTDA